MLEALNSIPRTTYTIYMPGIWYQKFRIIGRKFKPASVGLLSVSRTYSYWNKSGLKWGSATGKKVGSRRSRQRTGNNKSKEVCTTIPGKKKNWAHKGLREGQSMAQKGGSSVKAWIVRPDQAMEPGIRDTIKIRKVNSKPALENGVRWWKSIHWVVREETLTGAYPGQNLCLWAATRKKKTEAHV